ncbi:lipase member H isoform X2 [Triplophysa rosa]|uniref:lipase member H isoform X2 n=1 Tax=Triplophysa rosa TaxID=992332 RepID=UPI002545C95C|nr:lipase member H isoform X2 [Triplophysa rosa]
MLLWRFLGLVSIFMLCEGQDSECDNFTDLDFHESFMGTNLYVRLLLYTRANLDCGHKLPHHNFTLEALFDVTRPTTFVIHGYRPTGASPVWINHIVQLLAAQEDMNILVVDWNRGAANLNYFTAVANTRRTAANITGFIESMEKEGTSLDSIHLIGVSLGAHVAGFIGAMLGGRVGRITGKSYFVCDHQRSVFLYLCALNHTCNLTAYPCSSYADFLNGQCLQCETFKPASCPVLGYNMSLWRDTLLRLGQTRVFFSTTAEAPYSKTSYRVDIVTWNQFLRWGVVILRLHNGKNVIESRIDHKLLRFEQYTSTRLLAQFDMDLYPVQKISLRIVTGNVIGPRYKIRLLHIRITPLEKPDRPLMCRYDIILEENAEVSFRPLPCN